MKVCMSVRPSEPVPRLDLVLSSALDKISEGLYGPQWISSLNGFQAAVDFAPEWISAQVGFQP
jgi:hypothetical protein